MYHLQLTERASELQEAIEEVEEKAADGRSLY